MFFMTKDWVTGVEVHGLKDTMFDSAFDQGLGSRSLLPPFGDIPFCYLWIETSQCMQPDCRQAERTAAEHFDLLGWEHVGTENKVNIT